MPNPVEGLLEVYEDIVEVLLVVEISLTADSISGLGVNKPGQVGAQSLNYCGTGT